jgi:rhodanese-related sulfurtransferase
VTTEGLRRQLRNNNSIIPIDLRIRERAEKAYIPSAVSMPSEKLLEVLSQLPRHPTAPLVLYGQKEKTEAVAAFQAFRKAGYRNVSILKGDFEEWQKSGFRTSRGNISQSITYTPAPAEGVMSAKKFIQVVTDLNADTFLLDVRSDEEVAQGVITGAVVIPADEIMERIVEIPHGKQIVIYCKSGVRAQMVYSLLSDKGFTAKYLDQVVAVQSNGSFIIEE